MTVSECLILSDFTPANWQVDVISRFLSRHWQRDFSVRIAPAGSIDSATENGLPENCGVAIILKKKPGRRSCWCGKTRVVFIDADMGYRFTACDTMTLPGMAERRAMIWSQMREGWPIALEPAP